MKLKLYNSLTRQKETFTPLDPANVRMYVCGPTVYDRPHIGNARAVVVYDVLFRLLKHLYEPQGGKVTYARNITDVDDKINAAAKANGEPISSLTERVTQWFHDDMDALGNERPTHEPRATQEIQPIIALIEKILANKHAYVANGEVLFDVGSVGELDDYSYGKLSGKKLEDLIAGARIETKDHKRNPADFVLWKPALPDDDPSSVFDSPWGKGRPGWHIECSAMSSKYLGDDFDIHGGGADLKFPHHENEIAQSRCANPHSHFAKLWVHNGFVTVNGEKMSKSLGNFITVKDLLDKGVKGEVIRYALLKTKYSDPLDWTEQRVQQAKDDLDMMYGAYYLQWYPESITLHQDFPIWQERYQEFVQSGKWDSQWSTSLTNSLYQEATAALYDDLNTHLAFSKMYEMTKLRSMGTLDDEPIKAENPMPFFSHRVMLKKMADLLGILKYSKEEWFKGGVDSVAIDALVASRTAAKKAKNFAEADRIRGELAAQGIILEDSPQGTTWRKA